MFTKMEFNVVVFRRDFSDYLEAFKLTTEIHSIFSLNFINFPASSASPLKQHNPKEHNLFFVYSQNKDKNIYYLELLFEQNIVIKTL